MIKSLKIGKRTISENHPPLLVAEVSSNHQNSLSKTLKIVKEAHQIGLEAIKFQTFSPDEMTMNLNKKDFIIENTFETNNWNNRSLYSIYKQSHFPFEWHKKVFDLAKSLGLICFSSVFDEFSLKFLEKLNIPAYKIASLECLHFPLIEKVIKTGKPIIISTGTLNNKEIDELVNLFKKKKFKKYVLLHCVSQYPAENKNINLSFIQTLRNKYKILTGFSDHTKSLAAPIAATAFKACIIEKHFKLAKKDKTLDSEFSIDKNQMSILRTEIYNAWLSIGSKNKKLSKDEITVRKFRRSIYASKIIFPNQKIKKENIKIIRPGGGLEPKYFKKIIGKKVKKILYPGDPISIKNLIK